MLVFERVLPQWQLFYAFFWECYAWRKLSVSITCHKTPEVNSLRSSLLMGPHNFCRQSLTLKTVNAMPHNLYFFSFAQEHARSWNLDWPELHVKGRCVDSLDMSGSCNKIQRSRLFTFTNQNCNLNNYVNLLLLLMSKNYVNSYDP